MRLLSFGKGSVRRRLHSWAFMVVLGVAFAAPAKAFPERGQSAGSMPSGIPRGSTLPTEGSLSDPDGGSISMRTWVLIEARAEDFSVQVVSQISNPSNQRHLPSGVSFGLPDGYRGFQAGTTPSGLRVRLDGSAVRLEGPITPGEQQASFAFAIPHNGEEQLSFRMTMPSGTAEVQVGWVGPRGSNVSVEGFSQAIPGHLPNGVRLEVVRRHFDNPSAQSPVIACNLGGLPTRGSAPTIAGLMAAILVIGGLIGALRPLLGGDGQRVADQRRELTAGRTRLIEELVLLERARNEGLVGQETYESTHRELLRAAVRLERALGGELLGKRHISV